MPARLRPTVLSCGGFAAGGFSLLELLVTVVIVGILASMALATPGRDRERLALEVGLRRLRTGLDRGRMAAQRQGEPCGLALSQRGWQAPTSETLASCRGAGMALQELDSSPLQLQSNLPEMLRFTANGLLLDGGLVVLTHPRVSQRLCLVIGLPLGITRSGIYQADPAIALKSSHCRPRDAA
jgi:prepilin-type N-terminal cleavage/methylation domain-containing protein